MSSHLSEPSSPLSQVTAAEVAQALRNLLDSSKRDVDACDEVRCLLPEQDTEWPDGYDFEALEAAHTEESSAREALRNQHAAAELLLSRFDAHQAYSRQQALAVQQLAESNAAVQRAVASAEALSTPHHADSANSSPLSAPSSPLSTVTSDDLAKSLRRILDSGFAAPEVERAHDLLDRYDAQQADESTRLAARIRNRDANEPEVWSADDFDETASLLAKQCDAQIGGSHG